MWAFVLYAGVHCCGPLLPDIQGFCVFEIQPTDVARFGAACLLLPCILAASARHTFFFQRLGLSVIKEDEFRKVQIWHTESDVVTLN